MKNSAENYANAPHYGHILFNYWAWFASENGGQLIIITKMASVDYQRKETRFIIRVTNKKEGNGKVCKWCVPLFIP